jgi:N-acyl-D-aspartate/D-glutamate deacylase
MTSTVTFAHEAPLDLVIAGGRVIDPASGTDAMLDVGIRTGRIEVVSAAPLSGTEIVRAGGLVVTPGFVDLHSHAQDLLGARLQALDGVTTALELETGSGDLAGSILRAQDEGRPINFGYSASWAASRMAVVGGFRAEESREVHHHLGRASWLRPATGSELAAIENALEEELANGAIGIGILLGYCPGATTEEYRVIARTAAGAQTATFTHVRELEALNPRTPADGPSELLAVALETGAHMHCCHINSTARMHAVRVMREFADARTQGARVTTEAYPYGTAMTSIAAPFLDPVELRAAGMKPSAIRLATTGRRFADEDELVEARRNGPTSLVLVDLLDEHVAEQAAVLIDALRGEHTAVASDAMPVEWESEGSAKSWPPAPGGRTHPRSVGTFTRALRMLLQAGEPPVKALAHLSSVPAGIAAVAAPAMRRKGNLAPGSDADIVVLDLDHLTDRATFADPLMTSLGTVHVFVRGRRVVTDGQLLPDSLHGRAVTSAIG